MRFYFTEEDGQTRIRGSEIRAALVHAGHELVHGTPGVPAPAGTDLWFHGLGIEDLLRRTSESMPAPMDPALVQDLLSSDAQIVLFQVCDAENMSFDRIPAALSARVRLFLRNHWPADETRIPAAVRGRLGFLPPMMRTMAARAGRPLVQRGQGAFFIGTRTGFANLGGGRNAREALVASMRQSGLPFLGGIAPHSDPRYVAAPENRIERIHKHRHERLLRDARICLAPWGNHPITYRFFEGLAYRCLVVAQSLDSTRFLDAGLQAGRHYVRVAPDLSDLVDVVRHHLEHMDEAQRIADAGHALYRERLASRGPLVSAWVFEAAVASWGDVYRPAGRPSVALSLRSLAARIAPRRF